MHHNTINVNRLPSPRYRRNLGGTAGKISEASSEHSKPSGLPALIGKYKRSPIYSQHVSGKATLQKSSFFWCGILNANGNRSHQFLPFHEGQHFILSDRNVHYWVVLSLSPQHQSSVIKLFPEESQWKRVLGKVVTRKISTSSRDRARASLKILQPEWTLKIATVFQYGELPNWALWEKCW